MATTLQQLGDGVEVVMLPDGSWLVTQAGDATSSTVWEWDDQYAAAELPPGGGTTLFRTSVFGPSVFGNTTAID